MTDYEYVLNTIEEMAKDEYENERIVAAWNEKCFEQNFINNVIYENNEEFFNEQFETPWEAIEKTTFGHWSYNDPYVVFNGYNNLDSFYYLDDENSPICFQELANYIVDNDEYDLIDIDEDEMMEELDNE